MSLQLSVPFRLDVTLCCGQVFLWELRGDWWYGVVGGRVLRVCQRGGVLEFAGANEEFFKRYFGFDDDLDMIAREIGKDKHIKSALHEFWGLRIVRQDPWECLASFICATYKSVAAIQRMLTRLSLKFGEPIEIEGEIFHAFPSAERLAAASVEELKGCGLGYRASYLQKTSQMVEDSSFDVETIRKMPYVEAKRVLLEFPGVGPKVADCVLLFSLSRCEAFPVDVRVKRVLLRHYTAAFEPEFVEKLTNGGLSDSEYERLNCFGRTYFGRYAGYAQEYLYHYERCFAGTANLKKKRT